MMDYIRYIFDCTDYMEAIPASHALAEHINIDRLNFEENIPNFGDMS